MNYPKEVRLLDVLRDRSGNAQSTVGDDGNVYWIPARDIPWDHGFRGRLHLAWLVVFTGRADVLHWR